uniref:endo-polygalacturonase n=1 Tax=Lygus lineolaris TaxID=50650 RepID=A0A126CYH8_LYGLI|nr:polygalacturonase 18b [Lygus lineolaris]
MFSVGLLVFVTAAASAIEVNNIQQLENAKKGNDKVITLKNIQVPAGQSLDLMTNLKPGTTVEFAGRITFGFKLWDGPLVKIKGKNLNIVGKPGHVIDGEGHRWWDGKGQRGNRKPNAIYVQLEDSKVTGLYLKNAPAWGFSINGCKNANFNQITVDNKDGHTKGALNTDGFGVAASRNVHITNSKVNNQDDCLALQSDCDQIYFDNNVCEGGHGIAVIGGYGNPKPITNIFIRGCQVIKNNIGVRVKTMRGGKGLVKGVTFDNIVLKDISDTGIMIMGNYYNGGPNGDPTNGCPIQDWTINNVRGNVYKNGTNVRIVVANDASNWKWNSNVVGGTQKRECKGAPRGVKVPC